jgi:glucose/arabinose dehydrogenase
MFSSFVLLLFLLLILLVIHQTNSTNITFIPQPISITVADLPPPYATSSASKSAHVIPAPADPQLYVPEGFTVKLFMTGLISPRYLIYTPSQDILVSEPDMNRISCLVDTNNDSYPDQRLTFADASNGLNSPFGMAFDNGYVYVGNKNATRRYLWTSGSRNITGTGEVVMTYADNGHVTRTVVISPTGDQMFVSIGSATNVDIESLPRASVQQANLDGTNQTTYAYGLRNPVGLAFHPITHDFYVACQERDDLGDDLVPDYFTRIQQNDFYGWPYAYLSSNLTDPRHCLANGTSVRPDLVAMTKTPDVLFQAHSAVLDMRFYTSDQFPNRYQNGAFAAFHGSWNKNNGTGYKIIFIPFDSSTNRPMGYYEDFVYGFLTNPSGPDTFGRPVGLLVLNDGSLLFSEDGNDCIYLVQYAQSSSNTTITRNITANTIITDAPTINVTSISPTIINATTVIAVINITTMSTNTTNVIATSNVTTSITTISMTTTTIKGSAITFSVSSFLFLFCLLFFLSLHY